jgi:hypothetical protein
VQIPSVERELCTDGRFEGEPPGLNRGKGWGVGRQAFAGTAYGGKQSVHFGGRVKSGIIKEHDLPWLEHRHQTVLHVGFKEGPGAVPLKHERGTQRALVQSVNKTDPLGAVSQLLAPTRLPARTPAVSQGLRIVEPGLIPIDQLFRRQMGHLGTELCSQGVVAFSIAEGLFLCV